MQKKGGKDCQAVLPKSDGTNYLASTNPNMSYYRAASSLCLLILSQTSFLSIRRLQPFLYA
jgi:hypothetical protein